MRKRRMVACGIWVELGWMRSCVSPRYLRGASSACAGHWTTTGAVTGLSAGIALLDLAALPEGPGSSGVKIGGVTCPNMILPFVHGVARCVGRPMTVYKDQTAWASFEENSIAFAPEMFERVEGEAQISVRPVIDSAGMATFGGALRTHTPITRTDLDHLNALALQMTVPTSTQSQAGLAGLRTTTEAYRVP